MKTPYNENLHKITKELEYVKKRVIELQDLKRWKERQIVEDEIREIQSHSVNVFQPNRRYGQYIYTFEIKDRKKIIHGLFLAENIIAVGSYKVDNFLKILLNFLTVTGEFKRKGEEFLYLDYL